MNNNNKFIDDKGLSESTSPTHLLSDDDSADTIDINIILLCLLPRNQTNLTRYI